MEAEDAEQRMLQLQKMRVTLVILLSQETSKRLSKQQRVAGKAIEVMCAERDASQTPDDPAAQAALAQIYHEDSVVKNALAETDAEIARMEDLLAKIDTDISAMCQS